ncbi:cytochrome b5-like Heme/Steroid binding domain-containing protein [Colletotrichum nymphaeae SA-01]|uniref:Cytochrome b5-like Heme/Steroid binding domain-containing protein n=1 Tax=Colletotrichum nymphaeae SA-01 TaxID=1460502 RepID=A0A135USM3_9PEZI|nr:cytochrome b5-like Heme/Steroid binding domain-containing protein [Colletotrichum nymphaeae SA-01]
MSDSSGSCWERYYGVGETHPLRRNGLSWMDPIFPSIDPQTLEIIEPHSGIIPQPSPPELDDLLLSERQQLSSLSGLRTWEAAVLAKTEAYTTTGEGQVLISNEIQVDESSWLPVWSRDRWMIDFTAPPSSSTNWSGSRLWSAHDPIIWGVLRKAIQIADNIVRKSLEGDWLQSLLIPENLESHETTLLSGSSKVGKIWRMKSSPVIRKPAEELIQLLSSPSLLKRIFWTFNDKTTLNSYQPDGIIKGLTAPYDLLEGPITIFVNISGIKTLLDANVTQSSRSAALVCVADTLVHELMHVIGFQNLSSEVLLQKLGVPLHGFEIFGPQEHQCELGWSFEQHAFGGTVFGLIPKRDRNLLSINYAPLILSINRFPHVSDPTLTYDFLLDSPTIKTSWPLPSLWHTSLSSEAFWTQIVSKYGYPSLKAPKMLEVTQENGNRGFDTLWFWPIEKSAWFKEDFVPQNFQADELKMSARSLHSRRLKYQRMRPWFKDTFAMWQMTPYSQVDPRHRLSCLTIPLVRRNQRDEFDTDRLVNLLIHPLCVGYNQYGVLEYEVRQRDFQARIHDENTTQWFWRAIGFLLLASLPVRVEEVVPAKQPKRLLSNPWTITQSLPLSQSTKDAIQAQVETACAERWFYPTFKLRRRHMQDHNDPYLARSDRHSNIDLAETAFNTYTSLCIEPAGLRDAFVAECSSLRAQLDADFANGYTSWLDFRFQVPRYPGQTYDRRTLSLLDFHRSGANPGNSPDKDSGDRAAEIFHGEDPAKFPSIDLPAFAKAGIVTVPSKPGESHQRYQLPFYTVAELYDNAKVLGDELILVENGHHLDVHKCSAICRSLELDEDELPEFTKPTFYGTQLTDYGVGCLYEADIPSLPLGRVVRVLREDDIAQCDGTGGDPLWIRIHNSVFDITHLKCLSEPALRRLLASNPGGDPSLELLQDGYSLDEIKKSLAPWRVGMTAKTPGVVADKHSIRTFTPQSLRRHEFRETGMYVAIENKVYNITGGLQCLVENGGRDITDLFNKYHQTNRSRVLKGLQELCIGNLIEQRQEYADDDVESLANDRPVLPHEIRFGREVYSVKALRDSEEVAESSDLADALSPYLGLDATEALQAEEYEDGPLMRFACLRGYIVATVEDMGYGFLEIEPEELRMFDGHTDECRDIQYDAFVASDGFVYDLTAAMLYGSCNPVYSKFKPFLGGIVDDEELTTYLDTHCENLICAVLVQEKTEDDGRRIVNWDPRKKVAPRYKMPIWANRPRKAPKPPAEDEIAPHIDTIEKAKEVAREEHFEKKEVFEPTPTATFLQNMINQLDEVNQPSFATKLEDEESRISCNRNTKGKESESKASGLKTRQLSRLEADLRRRKDEKVMREIAKTWQEVIASDESTLPVAYPTQKSAKHTVGGQLQEKESEEGEGSTQQDAAPPGMSRRALEVTKKRKPVFEIDEGPPKKRR